MPISLCLAAAMMIPLGTFVGNPNDASKSEQAATAAQFASFATTVGRTPAFMDTYIDYTQPFSAFPGNAKWNADSWKASAFLKGVVPVVGVPMAAKGIKGMAAFQAIAAGRYDANFAGIVNAWKSDGYPTIYARLGWEQNGSWFPWSQGSGASVASYAAAFRHIASVMHRIIGSTVKVVWNPNDGDPATATLSYPGDAYVDVIAIDQYSPSTGSAWGVAEAQDFALLHGKPFAIPETGTGVFGPPAQAKDVGPAWPDYLKGQLTRAGAPAVEFVNVWNHDVPGGEWAFSGERNFPLEAAGWRSFSQTRVSSSVACPS